MDSAPSYQGHRYPVEVISHCMWRYFRFPLNFREVEELMLQRGVIVSYETVRRWCAKFGQAYANELRRRLMSSTTESATVLTGMYAAEAEYLAAGGPGKASFDLLAPFFAPDVELHQADSLPYGGTWRGHKGTTQFFLMTGDPVRRTWPTAQRPGSR